MSRLICCCVAMCVLASCDRPADTSPEPPVRTQPPVPQPDAEASAILDRVQAAYLEAPGLEVQSSMTLTRGTQRLERKEVIRFDSAGDIRWEAPGVAMEVRGGRLLAQMDSVSNRVVDVPVEGTPLAAVEQVLGDTLPPPAVLLLRVGTDTVRWLDVMTGRLIGSPIATGHRVDDDGTLLVDVQGRRGTGLILIDSDTMWVRHAEAKTEVIAGGQPDEMRFVVDYDTSILESVAATGETIVVGDRTVVPTIELLERPASKRIRVEPGDSSPDFTLPGTDGSSVTLSSLRGSIVVLDFWARWCGPCRAGLPDIQRLYEATGRNASGVWVFGVNVQDGDNFKSVQEFWASKPFEFPSLVAGDEISTAWGLPGIPVTIVIGPDGKVLERVDGFTRGEWKHLVEVIEAAQQP
ncbi:MAG: TlpA disulfide reductase family protein [Phycisphaerales bacterium]|jgi:peroxiredoxin|nr:TlpA disulfide reductase family protein [Phycisphaerales bacterium]MDP6891403.1 TlpA disulfide reductase family protein [Phycisphaerales bacterium]